jgi:hypothetical protein
VKYVLLPLRTEALRSRKRSQVEADDATSTDSSAELSEAFMTTIGQHFTACASDTIPFVSFLIKLTIDCSKKQNLQRHSPDTIFIEALFHNFCKAFGLKFTETLPSISLQILETVEAMLQILIDRDIFVAPEILRSLVSNLTGLMAHHTRESDKTEKVRWKLVHQLIRLDADVFLVADTSIDGKENSLLESLLAQVTSSSDSVDIATSLLQQSIIQSLLKAYENARDLSTFVEIWEAQLRVVFLKQLPGASVRMKSIWDGDLLFNSCCEVLGKSSSTHQMSQMIEKLQTTISDKSSLSSNTSSEADLLPCLIILDCIFSSTMKEAMIGSLIPIATKSFLELLKSVNHDLHGSNYPEKWRLWKILGRIEEVWHMDRFLLASGLPPRVGDFSQADLPSALIDTAIKVQKNISKVLKKHSKKLTTAPIMEIFYMLNFLAFLEGSYPDLHGFFVEVINGVVQRLQSAATEDTVKYTEQVGCFIWDCKHHNIRNWIDLDLSILARLLLSFPELWRLDTTSLFLVRFIPNIQAEKYHPMINFSEDLFSSASSKCQVILRRLPA